MEHDQSSPQGDSTEIDEIIDRCLDACEACHDTCTQMVPHCLELGGKHAEVDHILIMMDCAEICRVSADLMQRGSEFQADVCEVCAEVCDRCAESCAAMSDDPMMQQCAEVCRSGAEACREMVNAMDQAM